LVVFTNSSMSVLQSQVLFLPRSHILFSSTRALTQELIHINSKIVITMGSHRNNNLIVSYCYQFCNLSRSDVLLPDILRLQLQRFIHLRCERCHSLPPPPQLSDVLLLWLFVSTPSSCGSGELHRELGEVDVANAMSCTYQPPNLISLSVLWHLPTMSTQWAHIHISCSKSSIHLLCYLFAHNPISCFWLNSSLLLT
jgi:hypothetical protein